MLASSGTRMRISGLDRSPDCSTLAGAPVGPSQAASAAGSATVAESPVRKACGASAESRERASAVKSPRLLAAKLCTSSTITARKPENSARRVRRREHQHQAFRRGEEHVGGAAALAGALGRRRVARAAFDRHGEPHFRDGPHQIALDVVGERLQRRDVKRVDALGARLMNIDERGQKAGQRLAAPSRRNQKRRLPRIERLHHRPLIGMRLPAARGEPGFHVGGRFGRKSRRGRGFAMAAGM